MYVYIYIYIYTYIYVYTYKVNFHHQGDRREPTPAPESTLEFGLPTWAVSVSAGV